MYLPKKEHNKFAINIGAQNGKQNECAAPMAAPHHARELHVFLVAHSDAFEWDTLKLR